MKLPTSPCVSCSPLPIDYRYSPGTRLTPVDYSICVEKEPVDERKHVKKDKSFYVFEVTLVIAHRLVAVFLSTDRDIIRSDGTGR